MQKIEKVYSVFDSEVSKVPVVAGGDNEKDEL